MGQSPSLEAFQFCLGGGSMGVRCATCASKIGEPLNGCFSMGCPLTSPKWATNPLVDEG